MILCMRHVCFELKLVITGGTQTFAAKTTNGNYAQGSDLCKV